MCGIPAAAVDSALGVAHVARVGTFSEPLVTLVHRLKFGKSWEIAGVLAPFLYQALLGAERTRTRVDLLVPVPLHWSRRATADSTRRRNWHGRFRPVGLEDGTRAPPDSQHARAGADRCSNPPAENMRRALCTAREKTCGGQNVWLIDDVTTTGPPCMRRQAPCDRCPKPTPGFDQCRGHLRHGPPPAGIPGSLASSSIGRRGGVFQRIGLHGHPHQVRDVAGAHLIHQVCRW